METYLNYDTYSYAVAPGQLFLFFVRFVLFHDGSFNCDCVLCWAIVVIASERSAERSTISRPREQWPVSGTCLWPLPLEQGLDFDCHLQRQP